MPDATANSVCRGWCRHLAGSSPTSAIVQFLTSAAIRTGNRLASNSVSRPTPDRPAVSLSQTVCTSDPNGVTQPRPVMTTRLRIIAAPNSAARRTSVPLDLVRRSDFEAKTAEEYLDGPHRPRPFQFSAARLAAGL